MPSDKTSIRRRVTEIEVEIEDRDSSPQSMRQYVDLLEKVGKIGVEGWTRVHVSISGRREELEDLADELQSWTPMSGWSPDALKLFAALREGEPLT
jgi:hypothetical protein